MTPARRREPITYTYVIQPEAADAVRRTGVQMLCERAAERGLALEPDEASLQAAAEADRAATHPAAD